MQDRHQEQQLDLMAADITQQLQHYTPAQAAAATAATCVKRLVKQQADPDGEGKQGNAAALIRVLVVLAASLPQCLPLVVGSADNRQSNSRNTRQAFVLRRRLIHGLHALPGCGLFAATMCTCHMQCVACKTWCCVVRQQLTSLA